MKLLPRLPVRLIAVLAGVVSVLATASAPAYAAFPGVPTNVQFVRIAPGSVDLTFVDNSTAEIEFQVDYKPLGTTDWRLARTIRDHTSGQPQSTGKTIRVINLPLDAVGGCYQVWAIGASGGVGTAQKCTAEPPHAMKMSRVLSWTGSSVGSYDGWAFGLNNQSLYREFDLDWTTDFCSSSPDQPAGYDFRMPCRRHDFGYRNFKKLDAFDEYKSRVDSSLLADLVRKCDTYSVWLRQPCYGLADLYYEAVSVFGFDGGPVSQSEIDRYSQWRAQLEAQHTANS